MSRNRNCRSSDNIAATYRQNQIIFNSEVAVTSYLSPQLAAGCNSGDQLTDIHNEVDNEDISVTLGLEKIPVLHVHDQREGEGYEADELFDDKEEEDGPQTKIEAVDILGDDAVLSLPFLQLFFQVMGETLPGFGNVVGDVLKHVGRHPAEADDENDAAVGYDRTYHGADYKERFHQRHCAVGERHQQDPHDGR